jgi:hypothetical protein
MRKNHKIIDPLDLELLIARCICCNDLAGSQALDEFAKRNGIELDYEWIKRRVRSQKNLWRLRKLICIF